MIIIFTSCSVKQEATIHSDKSGSVTFDITLEQFFLDTVVEMADLAEQSPTLEKGEIFDMPQIRKDFEDNPSITLRELSSPKPTVLKGSFTFQDMEKVFTREEELQSTDILSFTTSGNEKSIRLYLDRENFSNLSALFPTMQNPFFEMFGPQENKDTSRDEYLEMIGFAFGEKGPDGVLRSTVELTINVDGTIVSQEGGTIKGNKIIYSIPLIELLLLKEPLEYSFVFK
jgi:hypothetical protein